MLDLIGLRQRVSRLKIEDLGDIVASENVVTSFDPLVESKPGEKRAEFAEPDVRIRGFLEYSQ